MTAGRYGAKLCPSMRFSGTDRLAEVFDLHGHSKAKRAYAWGHLDGKNDERIRFVAVFEIPPVNSAETAV